METALERAVQSLLKAALQAEDYAATLDPDEDEAVIGYFLQHAEMIRLVANDWLPPETTKDNVVLFRGNPKIKDLPPENTRRIRPDSTRD